jgi:TonB family protein
VSSITCYSQVSRFRWIDLIADMSFRLLFAVAVAALGLCAGAAALEQPPVPLHVPSQEAEAHVLQQSYPSLPQEAQAARISGTVVLEITISSSGDVVSAHVISGQPSLAQRALEAVKGWKYQPFLVNGNPVQVTTEVSVGFKPEPPQRSWLYGLLFIAPYVLLATAWVRRFKGRESQPHWRSTTLLVGLLLLSVSLAELSAEFIYRYIQGHKLGITPTVGMWAGANALLCLVAGLLVVVGKGRGRFVSLSAAPILVFIWAIHVAF